MCPIIFILLPLLIVFLPWLSLSLHSLFWELIEFYLIQVELQSMKLHRSDL